MKRKKLLKIFIPILICCIIAIVILIIIFKRQLIAAFLTCILVTIIGLVLVIALIIKGINLIIDFHFLWGGLALIFALYCIQAVICIWRILL